MAAAGRQRRVARLVSIRCTPGSAGDLCDGAVHVTGGRWVEPLLARLIAFTAGYQGWGRRRCRITCGATRNAEDCRHVATALSKIEQDWFDELRRKAEAGECLDRAPRVVDDRKSVASWPAERIFPAAALRAVLTDPTIQVDPRGIRIRGVRFTDVVDLGHVDFAHPLRFENCVLDKSLNLGYSRIRGLTLSNVTVCGGLVVTGATIDGHLDLTGTVLVGTALVPALCLRGATVTNDVLARHGFRSIGVIEARGVVIGGDLDLTGATLIRPKGKRLAAALDGAQIAGHVFAAPDDKYPGARFRGAVSAIGLTVGHTLDLDGAKVSCSDDRKGSSSFALTLDLAHIKSNMYAGRGFTVVGTFRAVGVTVDGKLYLDGAALHNPLAEDDSDRWALLLDEAKVAGGVSAGEIEVDDQVPYAFDSKGMVSFRGATIGRDLAINGARLWCPGSAGRVGRAALDIAGANITGSVLAGEGDEPATTPSRIDGTLRAVGATVGSRLDLSGASVMTPGGIALNLEALTVSRLDLTPKHCDGLVNLVRAQVADLVVGKRPPRPVVATGWTVGDMRSPESSGGLRENWRLAYRWLNSGAPDVNRSCAERRSVRRLLVRWRRRSRWVRRQTDWLRQYAPEAASPSSPERARSVRMLMVRWRRLSGWVRRHTAWLRRNKAVSVQPWHALADVYDRIGDPAAARHLRFAAENKVTGQSPLVPRMARGLYCVLAGYGYYPLASIASMIVFLALSVGIVHGYRADIVPATQSGSQHSVVASAPPVVAPSQPEAAKQFGHKNPWLESITYTVDDVLPPAGQQNRDWTIPSTASIWLVLVLPAIKLALWALAALFLAGVAGLLRNKGVR